ncbi:hypothetical protein CN285_27290, partial [Bacillus cereus]
MTMQNVYSNQCINSSTGTQFAPQGILGGLLGSAAGGLIGDVFGQKDIGSAAGGIAGSILPFQAGPQLAPQGAI